MHFNDENNYFSYQSNEENDTTLSFDVNNLNFNTINNYRSPKISDPSVGFNRGNMFDDLYDEYKNYNYKVIVKNEKDRLILNIQTLDFALNDLALYLDLYPNDTQVINLFNDYNKRLKSYKNEYQTKYGPLTRESVEYSRMFSWIQNPWPWEQGGSYNG